MEILSCFHVKILGEHRKRDKGRRSKTKAKVSGWGPYKRIRRGGMAGGGRASQPVGRFKRKRGVRMREWAFGWGDGTMCEESIGALLPNRCLRMPFNISQVLFSLSYYWMSTTNIY